MANHRLLKWALIIAPAIVAMALELAATARFGVGLSPDSAVYLQAARRLAAGDGFTQLWPNADGPPRPVPLTWYPPGYPLLLAGGVKAGAEPQTFARFASALLLGLSVAVAVAMVWRVTRSAAVTGIAAAVLCLSTDQLEVFAFALSEPLFIAAVMIALLLLTRFIERPNLPVLLAAAGCASVSGMTRYIGLILIPVGSMLIVSLATRPFRRKLLDAASFVLVAAAASAAWFARNARAAGSSTGRRIEWHPVSWPHGQDLFDTVAQWILPVSGWAHAWWIGALIAAGCALTVACAVKRSSATTRVQSESRALPIVLMTFVLSYLLALAASISWIDAATPVDCRLLSPVYAPCIVLIAFASTRFTARSTAMISIMLLAATTLISDAVRTPRWVWRANQLGERLGYASPRWNRSRVMKLMPRLPVDMPIWTNASDATYLHAGRIDRLIPFKYTRDGEQLLDGYPEAAARLRATILESGGAVIYFQGVLRRGAPTIADLDRDLEELRRIEFQNDAVIYAHPSAARRFPAASNPHTMPTQ